ncbi:MAG: hypothetical protein PHX80_03075 [Candidatus Nanoarchaeia archaeon]|nr:hypothetical protein [Candidatus Nanoarchaeia archaeon]
MNPFKARKWYMEKQKMLNKLPRAQKKKIYTGFYLFHGIEWNILLFLLGNYFSFFFFLFLGFSFHLFIDLIYEMYDKGTADKFSLIWNYCQFKTRK